MTTFIDENLAIANLSIDTIQEIWLTRRSCITIDQIALDVRTETDDTFVFNEDMECFSELITWLVARLPQFEVRFGRLQIHLPRDIPTLVYEKFPRVSSWDFDMGPNEPIRLFRQPGSGVLRFSSRRSNLRTYSSRNDLLKGEGELSTFGMLNSYIEDADGQLWDVLTLKGRPRETIFLPKPTSFAKPS